MMTVKEQLIRARAVIESPENWAKSGSELDGHKTCALGALSRVLEWGVIGSPAHRALSAQCADAPIAGLIQAFNDTHTHAEVLAAYDRAIASVS